MIKSVKAHSRGAQALCLALLLCGTVFLGGCGEKITSKDSHAEANVKRGVKPVADAEAAVIETDNPAYGPIVIELYPNIAPKMVEQFKRLIKEGFYNGTTFHRINREAGLLQGGDPLSKDNDPTNDGTGNSPYPNVPAEFSDIIYERGTVGTARGDAGPGMTEQASWDTGNCQFFITLTRQTAFDERYTVFGRVIEGVDKAGVIAAAPVEPGTERPSTKIVIKSITLQPRANFK